MDREGELYKSDVDDPGEICPEAIEEEAQWDAIINQPIDGLLYDLDLLPEEITTEGQRATASIITEMHKRLATTRAQLAERTPEKVLGDIDRERDIQVVCKAVIENCKAYDDNGPDYCMHCYGKDWGKGLEHELNCPVLIAKDLSTGLCALDGKEKV